MLVEYTAGDSHVFVLLLAAPARETWVFGAEHVHHTACLLLC